MRPDIRTDQLANPLVLRTRIFAARELAHTSRYNDAVWVLGAARPTKQERNANLHFDFCPPRFRETARQLFSALLVDEPPAGEVRLKVSTIKSHFQNVCNFFRWLDSDEQSQISLAQVERDVLESYYLYLRNHSPKRLTYKLRAVRLLWIYRASLDDHLTLDPALLRGWIGDTTRARRARENRTPRITSEVLNPLLDAALTFVNVFAEDIVDARNIYLRQMRPAFRGPDGKEDKRAACDRVRDLLSRYEAEGRRLPGNRQHGGRPGGSVNLAHLAREAGCSQDSVQRLCKSEVESAVSDLGVDSDSYVLWPVRGKIDKTPWMPGVPYADVGTLTKLLQTACYMVIAFFSGMRDSETKHLERNCGQREWDSKHELSIFRVRGLSFKNESWNSPGRQVAWVAGEPVEQAIAVLESLQPANQKYLFAPLREGTVHFDRHPREIIRADETNRQMALFMAWVNEFSKKTGLLGEIPQDGRDSVTTSRFRRTLAWFLARRPGGILAGAMHYKHHSIQIFEGYAGDSASGFVEEYESERALERGELLAFSPEKYGEGQLFGPAAAEGIERIEAFRQHVAGFQGIVADNNKQMQLALVDFQPNVFVGACVTCIYDPARRLCGPVDADDLFGPALAECKPLQCRNASFTTEQLEELSRELDAAKADIAADIFAPLVARDLQEAADELQNALDSWSPNA